MKKLTAFFTIALLVCIATFVAFANINRDASSSTLVKAQTDDNLPAEVKIKSEYNWGVDSQRNKTYIVTTGEPLDASTEVVEIKSKQVVLSTEGQRRTLKLTTHYLNPSQVAPRLVSSRRSTPQRPPQSVRRTPTPPRAPTAALSQWQTRDGEIIRIGDARLKNPVKWELQRR